MSHPVRSCRITDTADRAAHIAKVEGNEEAVFFIQADGPWDVVMEK